MAEITLDELVQRMEKNNKSIAELVAENQQLSKQIQNYDNEYITISHACKKYDVSYRFLYNFISSGKLTNYSKGNRILLRTTEIEEVLLKESA